MKKSVGGKDHSKTTPAEKGTVAGDIRRSFVTNIELSNKLDAIAFWDRKKIKDVLYEAMDSYITAWEKKNGPVQVPGSK